MTWTALVAVLAIAALVAWKALDASPGRTVLVLGTVFLALLSVLRLLLLARHGPEGP